MKVQLVESREKKIERVFILDHGYRSSHGNRNSARLIRFKYIHTLQSIIMVVTTVDRGYPYNGNRY